MANIIIPTPLRKFTESQQIVETHGKTVKEALSDLVARFPDIGKQVFDDKGEIRPYINLFIGENDIRSLEQESTVLSATDTLSIVPAIAGGLNSWK